MMLIAVMLILGSQDVKQVSAGKADMVLLSASIWTGVDAKTAGSPEALAVRGERIVAMGRNDEIRRWIGPETQVIDVGGRRVIPGITDSHTHIISGGLMQMRLHLRDVPDRETFIQRIAEAARKKRPGEWLLGGRWSVESWKRPETPSRTWIDAATGDVPVMLHRMDGHAALVNTAALRLAGIDANGPPDPKGGQIERDPKSGEPTGILKESAMDLVARLIPPPDPEAMHEALLRAMDHLNSLGITSVHDMSEPEHLAVFENAARRNQLTLRIHSFVSTADWEEWTPRVTSYPWRDDMYRVMGFKGYMDGSLGSRTAFMREAYADAAPNAPYPKGQLTAFADPYDGLERRVAAADASGLQLAVHAIGDQANHLLLNAYENAARLNQRPNARHRIEHAQHLLLEDIPRFERLGVVASMQPFHKADDGRYAENALGLSRLSGSYAFRRLLTARATVVFGSDWPVVSADPFAGIDAAVNARTLDGKIWQADNAISVEQALRAYTVVPPFAVHREKELGTIELGRLCDVVVLTEDVLSMPAGRVGEVRAWMTICGGRVVYSHKMRP